MISVTATHRQGVELLENQTFAIDPEKIVSTRDRGSIVEIEYGETYDRRRQPITYQLTTSRAAIDALIAGDYNTNLTHPYLSLTVIWSLQREYRPPVGSTSYAMDLQEKYIVDIRDTYVDIEGTKTSARRIEFVPGSFVPVVIFVSEDYSSLVTATPAAVTTTTTTVAATTTTTAEVTTTTIEPTTTTTTEEVTTTTTTAEATTTTIEPTTTTTTTEEVITTTTTSAG